MSTAATTRLRGSHRATIVAQREGASEPQRLDIHAVRRASGMSQCLLAKYAEISRTRLSLAEQKIVELRQDETFRIVAAISEEPRRRASRIREVLATFDGDLHSTAENLSSDPQLFPASATAEGDLSRSCEEYGSKLVEHLARRDYPVFPREGTIMLAADAVQHEVETYGLTPSQAYAKIKQAQKRYLVSWAGKNAVIRARHWYSQARYLDDPKTWRKENQAQ